MEIQVTWYNEAKTIILWQFASEWEWSAYHAAINKTVIMMQSVDHIVDTIADMRSTGMVPPGALRQAPRWFVVAPDNYGVTVVVGANSMMRKLALTVAGIYKRFETRILFTETLEEAATLLQEQQRQAIS